MKKQNFNFTVLLIAIIFVLQSGKSYSQFDSTAILIIDKMSANISDMNSCSFKLETEYDIFDYNLGNIKHTETAVVSMKGSNKFIVTKKGDKGHKEVYYDGKNLTYYSLNNNHYAIEPAPSTSMETIEEFSKKYGLEFPGADILYPNLSYDIISSAKILKNLGLTIIDKRECYHIAWKTNKMSIQLWIANDEKSLPVQMSIVYTDEQENPQYEALFSDWKINPELSDKLFDFIIPSKATKVKFSPSK